MKNSEIIQDWPENAHVLFRFVEEPTGRYTTFIHGMATEKRHVRGSFGSIEEAKEAIEAWANSPESHGVLAEIRRRAEQDEAADRAEARKVQGWCAVTEHPSAIITLIEGNGGIIVGKSPEVGLAGETGCLRIYFVAENNQALEAVKNDPRCHRISENEEAKLRYVLEEEQAQYDRWGDWLMECTA